MRSLQCFGVSFLLAASTSTATPLLQTKAATHARRDVVDFANQAITVWVTEYSACGCPSSTTLPYNIVNANGDSPIQGTNPDAVLVTTTVAPDTATTDPTAGVLDNTDRRLPLLTVTTPATTSQATDIISIISSGINGIVQVSNGVTTTITSTIRVTQYPATATVTDNTITTTPQGPVATSTAPRVTTVQAPNETLVLPTTSSSVAIVRPGTQEDAAANEVYTRPEGAQIAAVGTQVTPAAEAITTVMTGTPTTTATQIRTTTTQTTLATTTTTKALSLATGILPTSSSSLVLGAGGSALVGAGSTRITSQTLASSTTTPMTSSSAVPVTSAVLSSSAAQSSNPSMSWSNATFTRSESVNGAPTVLAAAISSPLPSFPSADVSSVDAPHSTSSSTTTTTTPEPVPTPNTAAVILGDTDNTPNSPVLKVVAPAVAAQAVTSSSSSSPLPSLDAPVLTPVAVPDSIPAPTTTTTTTAMATTEAPTQETKVWPSPTSTTTIITTVTATA